MKELFAILVGAAVVLLLLMGEVSEHEDKDS